MKKIIPLLVLISYFTFAQEVSFEKKEIKIMRKTDEQNIPIKVKIDTENTNTAIEISQIEEGEVTLNPKLITYVFNSQLKEYVFNLQVRTFPESELKNEESRVILKLKFKKNGADVEKLLILKIIPFEMTTENFPEYILFTGTNIDPLGENLITSSSVLFNYNFKLFKKKKLGIDFSLYTHKNFSKDSSLINENKYFSPDLKLPEGLILGKSKVFTQSLDKKFTSKVRTFGGFANVTYEFDIWEKTRTYLLIGGEIIVRKFTSSLDPSLTPGDTLIYNQQLIDDLKRRKEIITPKALTKDSFFSPPTTLSQSLANIGFKVENSSKDFYFLIQGMLGYGQGLRITKYPDLVRQERTGELISSIRAFVTNKPTNISLQLDYRTGQKTGNFANFSIGFPLDIKGAFKK